jgi:uncharacterized protein YegP (UPF0339 family)
MKFVVYQDNGRRFHWGLVGDDDAQLAVSATAYGSREDAGRAAAEVGLGARSATGTKS